MAAAGGVPPCLPVPAACCDAGCFNRVSVASQATLRYQLAAANYRCLNNALGRTKAGLSQKLSDDNTIPKLQKVDGKWKSVLNGDSWAEKQVAKLTTEEVGGANREKLMWRLVTYLRQGNDKGEALRRLKESLRVGPDISAPLAIVTRDEID